MKKQKIQVNNVYIKCLKCGFDACQNPPLIIDNFRCKYICSETGLLFEEDPFDSPRYKISIDQIKKGSLNIKKHKK